MTDDPDFEPDDDLEFDGVLPALLTAGDLLAAVAQDDHERLEELKASDADWWNVAWTLALLLRGFREGEPASVQLVEDYRASDAQGSA